MMLSCTAALLLAAVAPATAPAPESVAMIIEASSRVEVRRLSEPSRRRASTGLRLAGGDSVFVPPGSMIVLLMRTGRMEQLSTSLVLPEPRDPPAGLARAALRPATPSSAAERIRPLEGGAAPVSPRNAVLVRADEVTFRWLPMPGATGYTVHLNLPNGQGFARYPVGADTAWTAPAGLLVPGSTYSWTVLAGGGSRVDTPVTFRVIGDTAWAGVQASLRGHDANVMDTAARLLLRALTFVEAGLLYDAEREFRALVESAGDAGGDVGDLHADVLARLGRGPGSGAVERD
ncbi:MAG TPA: hypothetical protein VK928_10575 [Longimicrobiales bacterium]|nr:hypothetical protein [Longimicrobiales bacterium]